MLWSCYLELEDAVVTSSALSAHDEKGQDEWVGAATWPHGKLFYEFGGGKYDFRFRTEEKANQFRSTQPHYSGRNNNNNNNKP